MENFWYNFVAKQTRCLDQIVTFFARGQSAYANFKTINIIQGTNQGTISTI